MIFHFNCIITAFLFKLDFLRSHLKRRTFVVKLHHLIGLRVHKVINLELVVVIAHVEAIRRIHCHLHDGVQRDRHQVAVLVLLENVEAVFGHILHEVTLLFVVPVHKNKLAQRLMIEAETIALAPRINAAGTSSAELKRLEPHLSHGDSSLSFRAQIFSWFEKRCFVLCDEGCVELSFFENWVLKHAF